MKANEWRVLQQALEEGVGYGIGRVFKYVEEPALTEEEVRERQDHIVNALNVALEEWFVMSDPYEGTEA